MDRRRSQRAGAHLCARWPAVSYTGVTIVASGGGAMMQGVATNFPVTGLTADTAYDLYVVVEDVLTTLGFAPLKVQFATPPNTYNITRDGEPARWRHRELHAEPGEPGQPAPHLHGRCQPGVPCLPGWSGPAGSTCMLVTSLRRRVSMPVLCRPLMSMAVTLRRNIGPTTARSSCALHAGYATALTANLVVSGAAVTDPAAIATYLASLDTAARHRRQRLD